ncbi:GCG_CRPN prefix-to-repeats domain-containing protein [Agrobacterium sp. El2ro-1b]|uniref:GCG_CRPN prefix-to-repeats domain-containing protein n=1 Tax=Agrobacterium sp. El2ro-1b TaxID=2969528 RepID=UPI003AAAA1AB
MRKMILTAGLIFGALFGTGANAMPVGQPSAPSASHVQTVDYACGRGYHLSPRGNCRPNGPPRYERGWDRRDRWEARREWRERQARREWRQWHDRRDYRDYRDRRDYYRY